MKIKKADIKQLIEEIGFKAQEDNREIYYKNYPEHNDYVIQVNFTKEKIDYGTKITLGDLTTSNFENSENFVVLECVNRVLEKGYAPNKLSLEHKWLMGRKEKGKLDILVMDKQDKAYLMIECKTWGEEYEKEKKTMLRTGGQLFSYFQQDKAAQYLCLYTSKMSNGTIEYANEVIKTDEQWRELHNQKEVFDHWSKNFKDNGIFEEWANAYDIEIKALTRGRLKELTEEDSGRIFNQFAEILRHNVVSDKPNAFNKIFNLFLCKIVDEDRKKTEELKFQWLEDDTNEELQKRLSDLYKKGMKEYLSKEVTDYNDEQIENKLDTLQPKERNAIREMFTRVRLHKNNEFAFKEVFDEKSFKENAIVVREVVELLQSYQIRYGHKQQFLGDFFELLLSTGIKQEAGQFFTPVPIAKFIISSLPIRELINQKIENEEISFLPYVIDYAAGSGHFLTEVMDEIQHIIETISIEEQKPSVKQRLESWGISPFDWANDYIFGIEADYRLVKTAKVSCFLNGDGLANIIHADGLDNFQTSTEYKGKLKQISQDNPKDNRQFDILVANPPYSVSAFKNTLKDGEESFELYNRLTDDSSEIECLFIERAKQLLKPGGWAGIILPSSILSNSGIYTDAREIILKYFNIKAITEFGSNTFMATGTNTVTLFLDLTNFELVELMNFKKLAFEKSISLGAKKKVQIKSKWDLVKLKDLCQVKIGGTPSRKEDRYYFNGTNLWLSISEMDGQTIFNTKEKITNEGVKNSNVKLIKAGTTLVSFKLSIGKTAIAGIDLYTNEAIASLELNNEDRVINKYLFYLFNTRYIDLDKDTMNAFGKSLNSTLLKEVKIPLPPKGIQEKIIVEIEVIKNQEQELLLKLDNLNNYINNQFSNSEFIEVNLGSIANFKNGLNYSAKSKGELVTVVRVKDFLENFSPNLDELEQVRIDGELNESYKLQSGDILVVRSNGSANLVGRFIYIDRLLTNTSYSGFTIRIRANSEQVNSKYLCYCLRTEKVRNRITRNPQGANIKSINQTMLSSISVPLPSLSEQLKIITKVENIEQEIIEIKGKLATIDNEKKLILKKYLE